MMRKKLLSLPILLLLTLSILSAFNVNMPGVSASSSPVIRVADPALLGQPANINRTGLGIGTFNVSIFTNYTGSEVWGYEFSLTYNPNVLEIVSPDATNGDLIINATHPARFLPPNTVNNTSGELSLTAAYFEGNLTTSGNGTLATVTFNVTDTGDSFLTLGLETRLIGMDAATNTTYNIIDETIPGQIEDGYFYNTGVPPTHDIEVTGVTHNATTGALAGESVNVSVTVLNNGTGTTRERFDVDVSYQFWSIGTETVPVLLNGASTLVSFMWNTTFVPTGNYTITATAGPVAGETDTADNTDTQQKVFVMSPSIIVFPDSIMDAALTEGNTFEAIIHTDYDATLISRSDLWGYEFTLTFNDTVLDVIGVTNGGNMPKMDTWLGDGSTTEFTTSEAPIIADSEEVYVNQTLMVDTVDYTIVDATGVITLTTAPELGILVTASYTYDATIMDGANFSAGDFGAGTLALTSNNVSTTVTGPGILAIVTFNVTGFGDTDITLGPETKLIGFGSYHDITLPHRLEHGFFTNGIDLKATSITLDHEPMHQPVVNQAYPTWTNPIEIEYVVLNNRPMSTGDYNVTLYYVNASGAFEIANTAARGLDDFEERTFRDNWTISNLDWGIYTIKVNITALDGNDVILWNNELFSSNVTIKIPGDIDGDGKSDGFDFGSFAFAFGRKRGEDKYDPEADLDGDGDIDGFDFGFFAFYFGKSTATYP